MDPANSPPYYATIQAAVNDAGHGDRILVKAHPQGEYVEQVRISAPTQYPSAFTLDIIADTEGDAVKVTHHVDRV